MFNQNRIKINSRLVILKICQNSRLSNTGNGARDDIWQRKAILMLTHARARHYFDSRIRNIVGIFWPLLQCWFAGHDLRCYNHDQQLPSQSILQIVFITEYTTAGTLRSFLRRSRINKKRIGQRVWRRWCRQILGMIIPPFTTWVTISANEVYHHTLIFC